MDLVGHKFGKYEVIERLGQGGMAEVYRAHQANLARDVAIKYLVLDMAPERILMLFLVTRNGVGCADSRRPVQGDIQHAHLSRSDR